MAGDDRHLGRWAIIRQQKVIDETDPSIQQAAITRTAIIGNGSLQHMPDVVEFVSRALCLRKHSQVLAIVNVVSI